MQYIFMHGLGQTPLSWDQVIARLDDTHIMCPNLFSFIEGRDVTYGTMYHAFREYCSSVTKPLGLCGISLGAVLALNYAIENSQKVASLILIAPQYRTPKLLLRFQTALFRIMPNAAFQEIGIEKWDMIRLLSSMLELDLTLMLNKITCPTLVISGRNDKTNQRAAMALAKQLSNARFELVENAGHEVNVDMPEKLAEMINSFMEEC